jgi:hypothetical protein
MTEIILIANGDLRLTANRVCWPAQQQTEESFTAAVRAGGANIRRGHPFDPAKGHGFIDSQSHGLRVFREIPEDAPLVVVEAVWQYSQHILGGLIGHKGPILTVANWSGQWPGLVGMLNLNGSMTKAGVPCSTLWSADFKDDFFLNGLRRWLGGEQVVHDRSHVHAFKDFPKIPTEAAAIGIQLARQLKREKTIIGVFDEGCMGMYNAIIPDELLFAAGVYKERLSQSALYAAMQQVSSGEAAAVRNWLEKKGMKFVTGPVHETDLTDAQIAQQCRMYIAAVRIAADYGCEAIGIQYQQGLKDLCAASDLVEGLLNNVDRPPVKAAHSDQLLFGGKAIVHFNEVDECAGLDGLITNRVWTKLGFDPETTLHDVRWGENYNGDYVWVFLISGAVPPKHLIGEYAGADSVRQPPVYFPNGGGTLRGVSKPGELVWSRIFVENASLQADIGRAKAIALPPEETKRRWEATTPQWPVMHAVLYGVTRDQFMGRHRSNHIQVAYAPDAAGANRALAAKAAMLQELGIAVHICGDNHGLG